MSTLEAVERSGWRDKLTRAEIQRLLAPDDRRAWLGVALDWGLVAAAMALVALAPHPVTVVLALFAIGGRQLGLAILMHDAAHRTLLSDRRWNDVVGNWLCGYPIWSDLHPYRTYHLQHHAKNWTKDDPDLSLVLPFPITGASFTRKVLRDLSGQTGIKFARAALHRSFLGWRRGDRRARQAALGFLATNAALFGILAALGHPALYLLWMGAWLTTNTLVTRIRSIAEHALVPDPNDPLNDTRTTLASWWERLFIAPNCVNYHLEHHLLMTVPHYRLPEMHALLRERGVLDRACVVQGYLGVLRNAASKPAA